MKHLKFIIPNTLTIINLLAGILAIVFVFEGAPKLSVILLLIAAVADLLDGLFAKLLNATSEFGKQLDSLSDLVSFGVAPSVFMYSMMKESINAINPDFIIQSPIITALFVYGTFLIAVFAALRLARFNIDTRKSSDFRGLPVPASTLIVIAVWLAFKQTDSDGIPHQVLTPAILLGLVVFVSFLMISNITMLSFKFQNFRIKENIWRYILIAGSVVIFLLDGISSLLYVMILYILLSIIKHIAVSISNWNKTPVK